MPTPPTGSWTIDPVHSSVTFTAQVNTLSSLEGRFDAFAGTVTFADDGRHHAQGAVQTSSIDTNLGQRDDYLRQEASFDADGHPEITFESSTFEHDGDERLTVGGELTIRGVAQPVELTGVLEGPIVDVYENERIGIRLSGTVGYESFAIGGLPIVADAVEIRLGLQAVRAEAA